MSDNFDLYGDLDGFQHAHEIKEKEDEYKKLLDKYNAALKAIEVLQLENKNIKNQVSNVERSFWSLLQTAKSELKRKETQIAAAKRERDDIAFRRNYRNRSDYVPTNQNIKAVSKKEQNFEGEFIENRRSETRRYRTNAFADGDPEKKYEKVEGFKLLKEERIYSTKDEHVVKEKQSFKTTIEENYKTENRSFRRNPFADRNVDKINSKKNEKEKCGTKITGKEGHFSRNYETITLGKQSFVGERLKHFESDNTYTRNSLTENDNKQIENVQKFDKNGLKKYYNQDKSEECVNKCENQIEQTNKNNNLENVKSRYNTNNKASKCENEDKSKTDEILVNASSQKKAEIATEQKLQTKCNLNENGKHNIAESNKTSSLEMNNAGEILQNDSNLVFEKKHESSKEKIPSILSEILADIKKNINDKPESCIVKESIKHDNLTAKSKISEKSYEDIIFDDLIYENNLLSGTTLDNSSNYDGLYENLDFLSKSCTERSVHQIMPNENFGSINSVNENSTKTVLTSTDCQQNCNKDKVLSNKVSENYKYLTKDTKETVNSFQNNEKNSTKELQAPVDNNNTDNTKLTENAESSTVCSFKTSIEQIEESSKKILNDNSYSTTEPHEKTKETTDSPENNDEKKLFEEPVEKSNTPLFFGENNLSASNVKSNDGVSETPKKCITEKNIAKYSAEKIYDVYLKSPRVQIPIENSNKKRKTELLNDISKKDDELKNPPKTGKKLLFDYKCNEVESEYKTKETRLKQAELHKEQLKTESDTEILNEKGMLNFESLQKNTRNIKNKRVDSETIENIEKEVNSKINRSQTKIEIVEFNLKNEFNTSGDLINVLEHDDTSENSQDVQKLNRNFENIIGTKIKDKSTTCPNAKNIAINKLVKSDSVKNKDVNKNEIVNEVENSNCNMIQNELLLQNNEHEVLKENQIEIKVSVNGDNMNFNNEKNQYAPISISRSEPKCIIIDNIKIVSPTLRPITESSILEQSYNKITDKNSISKSTINENLFEEDPTANILRKPKSSREIMKNSYQTENINSKNCNIMHQSNLKVIPLNVAKANNLQKSNNLVQGFNSNISLDLTNKVTDELAQVTPAEETLPSKLNTVTENFSCFENTQISTVSSNSPTYSPSQFGIAEPSKCLPKKFLDAVPQNILLQQKLKSIFGETPQHSSHLSQSDFNQNDEKNINFCEKIVPDDNLVQHSKRILKSPILQISSFNTRKKSKRNNNLPTINPTENSDTPFYLKEKSPVKELVTENYSKQISKEKSPKRKTSKKLSTNINSEENYKRHIPKKNIVNPNVCNNIMLTERKMEEISQRNLFSGTPFSTKIGNITHDRESRNVKNCDLYINDSNFSNLLAKKTCNISEESKIPSQKKSKKSEKDIKISKPISDIDPPKPKKARLDHTTISDCQTINNKTNIPNMKQDEINLESIPIAKLIDNKKDKKKLKNEHKKNKERKKIENISKTIIAENQIGINTKDTLLQDNLHENQPDESYKNILHLNNDLMDTNDKLQISNTKEQRENEQSTTSKLNSSNSTDVPTFIIHRKRKRKSSQKHPDNIAENSVQNSTIDPIHIQHSNDKCETKGVGSNSFIKSYKIPKLNKSNVPHSTETVENSKMSLDREIKNDLNNVKSNENYKLLEPSLTENNSMRPKNIENYKGDDILKYGKDDNISEEITIPNVDNNVKRNNGEIFDSIYKSSVKPSNQHSTITDINLNDTNNSTEQEFKPILEKSPENNNNLKISAISSEDKSFSIKTNLSTDNESVIVNTNTSLNDTTDECKQISTSFTEYKRCDINEGVTCWVVTRKKKKKCKI